MTGRVHKPLSEVAPRVAYWAILAAALTAVLTGVRGDQTLTQTAFSRLATVIALADDGTFFIDRPEGEARNRFELATIDKVEIRDRLVSSKPPILSLGMTAEYIVLRGLFSWDLDREEDLRRIVSIMSITFIGIPFLVGLVFFERSAAFFVSDPLSRVVGLFGLAFGTQMWGYATHINNHVPSASLLMIAVYFALGLGLGRLEPKAWRFAAFGLSGALSATLDLPAAIFVALAGLYLISRFPRQTLLWTTLGALPLLALHFGIMIAVTGSPLPVQMNKEAYLYEASYWRNPRGVDALNHPAGTYLFHMTFGRVGLFLLYPITLLGIVSPFIASARKDASYRPVLVIGLLGFLVLTAYYALSTNNYGGVAFGFRWYIIAMPLLLLMATRTLAECSRRWQWACVGILMAVSVYSGWQCHLHPWEVDAEWTTRIFGPTL